MEFKNIKKIHFVGIKGVGMAPLAIIAKQAGFKVSGSDVSADFITKNVLDREGIADIGDFNSNNVLGKDLVIITAAHGGYDNVEAVQAKEKGIPIMTQAEALGIFQEGKIFGKEFLGICVSGSHGKTTTTAMIATILQKEGLDPSYTIGTGEIPSLDGPGHFGHGRYFVCEADEYITYDTPKFLFLNPKIIVVTNIDFDHPDVYSSIQDIEKTFLDFANKLPTDGVLIACGDGGPNQDFLTKYQGNKITFGFSSTNDYVLDRVSFKEGKTFFWVKYHDSILGEFSIDIFGEQNALDATASIIACIEAGLSIDKIKHGLSFYKGSNRRSEFVRNTAKGALVYDDYAHHPKEIEETLKSFKKNFPDSKIIPIFQPHMYSRTKLLLDDFVKAFDKADEVIITEIFPSFREKRDPNFSAKVISDEINKRSNKSIFLENLSDVVEYLNEKEFSFGNVLITMGAGDVYQIGKKIK